MKRLQFLFLALVVSASAFAQTSRKTETIKMDRYTQWTSACLVYTELITDLVDGSRWGNLELQVAGEQNYSCTNQIPGNELPQMLAVLEYAQSELISKKPANMLSATFKATTGCSVGLTYFDESLKKGWLLVVQTDELDRRSTAFIKVSDLGGFIQHVKDCKAAIDAFVAGN
ncbi:MAG: hypothetical protein IJL42_07505 [Bacteroidales bacterium]|nr:hypothetical protein [Bacteroidales bacterium]